MRETKYAPAVSRETLPDKIWSAALYIRLSREDELVGESNSVSAQREILREFVAQQPDIEIYDFYVDDGWTGTNFDRPDFQRMMEDIRAGRVDCVIVKDHSRFGRNSSKAMELMTDHFVTLGVRFIVCNGMYDSLKSTPSSAAADMITLGVTSVINESVSATTSANVRGTLNLRRRQGKFIGSFACYGYRKDPADHHRLLVDEEAADVVRLIYRKYLDGEGILRIAKDLNESGIPNPTAYKQLQGQNYRHNTGEKNDGLWGDHTIRRILSNEMYLGNMVQGKMRNISYKVQKARPCPPEEWYVVEGTHEAIIDPETFHQVQARLGKGTHSSRASGKVELLAGLVHCADCGRIMSKKTNTHAYGTYSYYRCTTRRKMDHGACTNHTIRIDKLEAALLETLNTMIAAAGEMDQILLQIREQESRREGTHLTNTLEKLKQEREKVKQIQLALYPDWKAGTLTKEEYMTFKAEYQEKLDTMDRQIDRLKESSSELEEVRRDNEFLQHFAQTGRLEQLTRPLLTELVREIRVHEGGRIEVELNFSDAFEELIEALDTHKDTAVA